MMATKEVGNSEAMASVTVSSPSVHKEIAEVFFGMKTGSFRGVIRLDQSSRVTTLKTIFSSIVVTKVQCEVRQSALIGTDDDDILSSGHIYVALIPTGKNTDAATGLNSTQVNIVPNKQSFPLSSDSQVSRVFDFDLTGYETDLASDPRRQQGVVLWIGNSGVGKVSTGPEVEILRSTWRVWLECSGNSTLW